MVNSKNLNLLRGKGNNRFIRKDVVSFMLCNFPFCFFLPPRSSKGLQNLKCHKVPSHPKLQISALYVVLVSGGSTAPFAERPLSNRNTKIVVYVGKCESPVESQHPLK